MKSPLNISSSSVVWQWRGGRWANGSARKGWCGIEEGERQGACTEILLERTRLQVISSSINNPLRLV